jgi:ABC-type glycerol-3-phosphate transport system permease component
MPIIARIGRRSLKVRMLVLAIYALLLTGAVTMLYPFALMIAGSTKSEMDKPETRVVPGYLTDEATLWAKHVEGLFNESLDTMRQVHDVDFAAFSKVAPPERPNRGLVDAWLGFLADANLPDYTYTIGYVHTPITRRAAPHAMRAFKRELIERFDNDIQRCNRELGTDFVGWNSFLVLPERHLLRREVPMDTPLAEALRAFKVRQPLDNRYYFTAEGFFRYGFLKAQYTRDIDAYNREHGTSYASYDHVHLRRRLPPAPTLADEARHNGRRFRAAAGGLLRAARDPSAPAPSRGAWRGLGDAALCLLGLRTDPAIRRARRERKDWLEFARTILNLLWIRADAEAAPLYRRFLEAKYADVATLNRRYGTSYASFETVPLIDEPPGGGRMLSDWAAFLEGWKDPDTGELHILPSWMIRIHSVEFLFRDRLRRRYGTIERLNQAMGTRFAGWLDVMPPQRDAHWLAFREQTGQLRAEFTVRNYLAVIDYLVLHGRGIINTAIYCALAVLGALLVNPLAAYALSRYKPPSSYKVLLFLMLTMAFPPMVAQIPTFLMLREFGLLNTFGALILPTLANGYSIFLLKGFFDSQPQELYESAALDGAGEFRIFWQITMSLSKPILAVIALNTFKMAYANFMFALLICQDNKMWTLMVWLYELQRDSGQGVIYASLIVAAVPIFLMFALCQNIIMRGIVVPVEK